MRQWSVTDPGARTLVAMRVAAVDLGSNSFHLVIADVHPDGSFTPVSGEKPVITGGRSGTGAGGTVSVTGSGNSITSTAGTAINMSGPDFAATDATSCRRA